MRYLAPARASVERAVFAHPGFSAFSAYQSLLADASWPEVESFASALGPIQHRVTGQTLMFVKQDAQLLADGLHYEARIFERQQIATRAENWHDLFNALIWGRYPALKSVINAGYVAEFPAGLSRERSRRQMAITHFDEAGLVVHLNDPARLAAWDRHDWPAFFAVDGDSGRWDVSVTVFGHALLEHLLQPHQLLVGKALVVVGGNPELAVTRCAAGIAASEVLHDPQALRPLPLSGVPGWHAEQSEAFYRSAACFRPLRPGRTYPAPMQFVSSPS